MALEIAGKKVPKWALIGGAGVVVAGGIWLYKRSSNAASSSATTNPSAIDPVTGLPYSEDQTTDPLTGMTYLAEAQEYGSVSAAEAALLGSNSAAYDYAGGGDTTGTDTTSTTASTPTTTTTASTPTTTATPGTTASTPTATTTSKTTYQFPAPTGLTVTSVGSTSVNIKWNPVAAEAGHSPTGYTVAVYQTNGKQVYQQVWQGTSGTISGLHTAWTYHVNVWANGGTLAPANSSVSFTTKS
jgi:Fibronectin type III domain